jgi:hypothetical protein
VDFDRYVSRRIRLHPEVTAAFVYQDLQRPQNRRPEIAAGEGDFRRQPADGFHPLRSCKPLLEEPLRRDVFDDDVEDVRNRERRQAQDKTGAVHLAPNALDRGLATC